jgi:probable O-glycosylation ligase (exosortase A-associated)
MLRTIFVLMLVVIGAGYSLASPFYAVLFYLWVAYFRPENWVFTSNFVVNNLSFLVGAWVVLYTILTGRLRATTGTLLIVLFLLQGAVSMLFSPMSDVARAGWIEFAKPAAISCMIIALVDSVAKLRLTLLVLSFSLAFEGAKQGWLELIRHPGQLNGNTLPMLGDNNGVALGMLVLVSILVALARSAPKLYERRFEQFLAVGVLYRALSTYSRGGFLAALALGGHFAMRSRYRVRALMVAGILLVLALSVLPSAFWDRMSTIDAAVQDPDSLDASSASRLYFWQVAVVMANDHPLTGIGMNVYPAVYDHYDASGGLYGRGRACHSSWFTLLSETGYTGLSIFLVMLVYAFRSCRMAMRLPSKDGRPSELAIYAAGLEGGLIVFIVAGTFLSYQYAEIWWHVLALSAVTGRLAIAASREAAVAPQ